MKLRNLKGYNNLNELKQNYKMRIIAGIMAVLTPITAAGCVKKEVSEKDIDISEDNSTVLYDDSYEQIDELDEEIDIDELKTTIINEQGLSNQTKVEQTTKINNNSKLEQPTVKFKDNESYSLTKSKTPNLNVFFGDRKSYNEYTNNDLNSIIGQIKNINVSGKFNAEKYVQEELDSLKTLNYFNSRKDAPTIKYDFIVNGKVDVDKLYDKIVSNNRKNGLQTNATMKKLIKYTAQAVSSDYEYYKKNYPSFNTNNLLYRANDMTIGLFDLEYSVSNYSSLENRIHYNLNNIHSDDDLLEASCHEVGHMATDGNFDKNMPVYHEGLSLDSLTNINSALSLEFIGETNIDQMAYEAAGFGEVTVYYEEFDKLQMLSYSTGKSQEYFRNAYLKGDQNAIINAFEPEFQDFKTVYAALAYANGACGYGSYQGINCDDNFRKECFEKFRTSMIKNGYTRIFKSYFKGEISFDEMNEQLDMLINICRNCAFDYGSNNNQFDKNIDQLNNIVSLSKNKTR